MTDEPIVVPYDPRWPKLSEEARDRIEHAIGLFVEEIEHVGGTAVPGLAAKPTMDIMVVVESLADYSEAAEEYARLKRELAGHFREDREAYTRAKTEFIRGCVYRAEVAGEIDGDPPGSPRQ